MTVSQGILCDSTVILAQYLDCVKGMYIIRFEDMFGLISYLFSKVFWPGIQFGSTVLLAWCLPWYFWPVSYSVLYF